MLFIAGLATPTLYSGNQNTKFLHGLMAAVPERLGADWTAGTVDGLPLFTALVYAISALRSPELSYVLEAAILSVYCLSLLAFARLAAPRIGSTVWFQVLIAGIFVVLGYEFRRAGLDGVAGQSIIGGYLLPSEFGAFYLPALLLARRRHPMSLILVAFPAAMHPAYIALSAILMAVFLLDRRWSGVRTPPLLLLSSLALILVPPMDLAVRFAPSDGMSFALANDILAFERIPHHSDPARWLGHEVYRKLALAAIAIVIAPRGAIRNGLAGLLAFAAVGAVFVLFTRNSEVALMAPWRASVIIVPVSSALVLGWLTERLYYLAGDRRIGNAVALVSLGGALWAGALGARVKINDFYFDGIPDHIAFIRGDYTPGDIYLTSPGDAEFRLAAMAAQYVSHKTHPYLDTEVIEWRRRVGLAGAVFGQYASGSRRGNLDCSELGTFLETENVNRVVVMNTASSGRECAWLAEVFSGETATVYRVVAVGPVAVPRAYSAADKAASSR